MPQIASRFEEGGVGIGKTEAFRLALSLRKLSAKQPVQKLRFWGGVPLVLVRHTHAPQARSLGWRRTI